MAKAPRRPAGYSGTPLAKKLGITEGNTVLAIGAPPEFRPLLEPLPAKVTFARSVGPKVDVAHVFTASADELARRLTALRQTLRPDATVWVSWPKEAAKVPTDVTENVIRDLALPLGFVDVKVCAISDVWSGLRLFVRKELRG